MNSDREWLQTCLYGQHDIWADWVRFGERIADTQEAAGWGTPHALRLLNEQNARWLEATRLWVQEWERMVSAGPDFDYSARQALVRNRIPSFADHDAFSFNPPRRQRPATGSDDEEATAGEDQRVVADKLPLTLDRNGAGQITIDKLPPSRLPRDLIMEASYADPNGEIQTLRHVATLWPAGVVAGIRTEGWVSASQKLQARKAPSPGGRPSIPVSVS